MLHIIACLCNGAKFDNMAKPVKEWVVKGDPTDMALLCFAENLQGNGYRMMSEKEREMGLIERYRKLFEVPFNLRKKWMMSIIHDTTVSPMLSTFLSSSKDAEKIEEEFVYKDGIDDGMSGEGTFMLVKGAPDILFPSCGSIMRADGCEVAFGDVERERLGMIQSEWSGNGQRVLALWVILSSLDC